MEGIGIQSRTLEPTARTLDGFGPPLQLYSGTGGSRGSARSTVPQLDREACEVRHAPAALHPCFRSMQDRRLHAVRQRSAVSERLTSRPHLVTDTASCCAFNRLSAEVRSLRRQLCAADTAAGATGSVACSPAAASAASAQHERDGGGEAPESESLVLRGAETVARVFAAMLLLSLLGGGDLPRRTVRSLCSILTYTRRSS